MGSKTKIFIVDDNSKFIEGVQFMLSKEPSVEVIGTAGNGIELFDNPIYGLADIILLDIEMPKMNGFETAKKINWLNAKVKLIAITMYQDKVYLEKLVSCGFRGFVNKEHITDHLLDVIEKVKNNEFFFPDYINIG